MDSSQVSSFIPKAPVRGAVTKRRVKKVYVFTYIIYILFICSLIAGAVFWFLLFSANNKLAAAQEALTAERSKFNEGDVVLVTELSERMQEANALLEGQVSMLRVLEAIEAVAVSGVSMTGFDYQKNESANLALALVARSNDFNSARFQREVLSSNPVLASAYLTNVSYGTGVSGEGDASVTEAVVAFTINKTLEPGALEPRLPLSDEVASTSPAINSLDTTAVTSSESGTAVGTLE